ncbi:unnamed protein product [Ranitomeya imitator]|uniref:FF domain-containing protein n=1 Tax=Ranitomeya imitator TaxID=111125 RepID=A0ABN9MGG7_9NEOB|nr:unnamed protein product [Ranitomeya imitator]
MVERGAGEYRALSYTRLLLARSLQVCSPAPAASSCSERSHGTAHYSNEYAAPPLWEWIWVHIHYCNERYHVTAQYRKKLSVPGEPGTCKDRARSRLWMVRSMEGYSGSKHCQNLLIHMRRKVRALVTFYDFWNTISAYNFHHQFLRWGLCSHVGNGECFWPTGEHVDNHQTIFIPSGLRQRDVVHLEPLERIVGLSKVLRGYTLKLTGIAGYIGGLSAALQNAIDKPLMPVKLDFFDLLANHHLDAQSRWSKVKDKIESDSRYKAVESSSAREDLFKQYIEKIVKNLDAEKEKELERQARIEASLREREREVQKARSEQTKEIDREREQHKREEAIQNFKALLSDMVRSSDVSWSDTRRTLRKDHRWESGSLLEREEKEKLFNEHIDALTKKKREHFRQLLDETYTITLTSTWKEVKKAIKDDPRFIKFSSSDRKRQREFEEYIRDKHITAKADFRTLLKETKFITYRSKKLVQESDQHLKDVEKILQNDKRYLVLDCIPDERRKLIVSYVDDLDRRGPPPPPTASEPARRSTK